MIEALETLDEFHDTGYDSYVEYEDFKSRFTSDPTYLYINEKHPHLSEWRYFAISDGLEVVIHNGETKIC
ncbi:MAG: hypothetical protein ACO3UU_03150 [Minisyncoccia bacterium]|jgi:hypothetical protein